jgi:hypothetical protein
MWNMIKYPFLKWEADILTYVNITYIQHDLYSCVLHIFNTISTRVLYLAKTSLGTGKSQLTIN